MSNLVGRGDGGSSWLLPAGGAPHWPGRHRFCPCMWTPHSVYPFLPGHCGALWGSRLKKGDRAWRVTPWRYILTIRLNCSWTLEHGSRRGYPLTQETIRLD